MSVMLFFSPAAVKVFRLLSRPIPIRLLSAMANLLSSTLSNSLDVLILMDVFLLRVSVDRFYCGYCRSWNLIDFNLAVLWLDLCSFCSAF